jgi:hypothetical protein
VIASTQSMNEHRSLYARPKSSERAQSLSQVRTADRTLRPPRVVLCDQTPMTSARSPTSTMPPWRMPCSKGKDIVPRRLWKRGLSMSLQHQAWFMAIDQKGVDPRNHMKTPSGLIPPLCSGPGCALGFKGQTIVHVLLLPDAHPWFPPSCIQTGAANLAPE